VLARPAVQHGDGGVIGVSVPSSSGVVQRLGVMQTGLQQRRIAHLQQVSAHTPGCQAAWECRPHRLTTGVTAYVKAKLSIKVHEQWEVARDAHVRMVSCNVMPSLVTAKRLLT